MSQLIHDGDSHRVYKSYLPSEDNPSSDKESSVPVAVKMCRPVPSANVSRLYNEYNIVTQRLASCSGTRAALKKDKFDANDGSGLQPAIFFTWVDGVTLGKWLEAESSSRREKGPKSFDEEIFKRLHVAHGLASSLAAIHEAGVVHQDFASDNVIVGGQTNGDEHCYSVKIIDFGFAEVLHGLEADDCGFRVNDDLPVLARLLKDLFGQRYWRGDYFKQDISELSRSLMLKQTKDWILMDKNRSDGNSESTSLTIDETVPDETLGLAGGTAFTILGNEKCEDLVQDLPSAVLRVLADAADYGHGTRDTRYETAREIAEDLAQMLDEPTVFLLNPQPADRKASIFQRPPRKLYGREREMEVLMGVASNIAGADKHGRTEVVLIEGRSGTGKTALLQQFQNLVVEKGFSFGLGKFAFDQLKKNLPYSALVQALNEVVQSILTQEETALADVREKILNAVGTNGRVLTHVIPSLAKVIGDRPEPPSVEAMSAKTRLQFAFRSLVSALSSCERPLILVFDDLQWADKCSMDLIQDLIDGDEHKHFIFIGCYRDDELTPSHTMSQKLNELRLNEIPFTSIHLKNLNEHQLCSYISEILHLPRRLIKGLAETVQQKTEGNAFFVSQLLSSLAKDNILVFSAERERWEWDKERLESKEISDNIVEVMVEKILDLDGMDQKVLETASCIGSVFDLATLKSCLCIEEYEDLNKAMKRLSRQGLVHRFHADTSFKFSHDRIQQAAYSLIPKKERAALHVKIGRVYQEQISPTSPNRASCIFRATDQLNRGMTSVPDGTEKIDLARLNVKAGREAKSSCAFTSAAAYLEQGLWLLDDMPNSWIHNYQLMLELHDALTETKCCSGNFHEAQQIAHTIIDNATSDDDKFHAYDICVQSLFAQERLKEGLDLATELLSLLGKPLPKKQSLGTCVIEYIKTKKALRNKTDEYITALPRIDTDNDTRTCNTLGMLSAIGLMSGSVRLTLICTLRNMRLSLRYGICDETPITFAMYGGLLMSVFSNAIDAYRFTRLGLALLNSDAFLPRAFVVTNIISYGLVNHWVEPIQVSLAPLLKAYQVGMQNGCIEPAYRAFTIYSYYSFFTGQPLGDLSRLLSDGLRDMVVQHRDTALLSLSRVVHQATLNLRGLSPDPVRLDVQAMPEEELLSVLKAHEMVPAEDFFHLCAAVLAYIFCDYSRAADHLTHWQGNHAVSGGYPKNVHMFYVGLSSLALARSHKESKSLKKRGFKAMKVIESWAKNCPHNNMHKVLLLKAELSACGNSEKMKTSAKAAFRAAIDVAGENNCFLNDEALACERAAIFYAEIGENDNFSHFIARSHSLYAKWGAKAKTDMLERQHPDVFGEAA